MVIEAQPDEKHRTVVINDRRGIQKTPGLLSEEGWKRASGVQERILQDLSVVVNETEA